nr:bifunctional transcriptional activator/dna repair enzyme ada [Quercus suber]
MRKVCRDDARVEKRMFVVVRRRRCDGKRKLGRGIGSGRFALRPYRTTTPSVQPYYITQTTTHIISNYLLPILTISYGMIWSAIVSRLPSFCDNFLRVTECLQRLSKDSKLSRVSRANVAFFDNASLAESAGFRACKRCRPEHPATAGATEMGEQHAKRRATAKAKAVMAKTGGTLAWKDVAAEVGLTPRYLFEAFKTVEGVTPGVYATNLRANQCSNSTGYDRESEEHCTAGTNLNWDDLSIPPDQDDGRMSSRTDLNNLDMAHCSLSSDEVISADSHCFGSSSPESWCLNSMSAVDFISGAGDTTICNDICEDEIVASGDHAIARGPEPPSLTSGVPDEWCSWIDLDMRPV